MSVVVVFGGRGGECAVGGKCLDTAGTRRVAIAIVRAHLYYPCSVMLLLLLLLR